MDTREKLIKLETELNKKFINRNAEIRGLLVTMLARGNMVLLGQAGTAKTDMVQTLAQSIKSDCFETILTRTSSPEELFGSYSIKELEKGNYVRNTANTLATSQFGFIDEVFKSNSAVLNGLLGVLAQRTYRNGNAMPSPIPLQLLVGASNEMPEGGADGELAALWDRFEMRYVVEYIKDERSFTRLLAMKDTTIKPVIDMADVITAQKEVVGIDYSPVETHLVGIWKELKQEGYYVSDRKWRNALKYLRANAWLEGRTEIGEDDLEILSHMFWQSPEQIKPIRKIINKFCNPELTKAQESYDIACELIADLGKFTDDEAVNREKFGSTKSARVTEVHGKLMRTKKILNNVRTGLSSGGRSTKAIDKFISQVNGMIQDVVNILTGVNP